MSNVTIGTIKRVAIILGVALMFWFAFKQCDTSIAVGKNAVVIPGECVVINYDATDEDWKAAYDAWVETVKKYPKSDKGHTKIWR